MCVMINQTQTFKSNSPKQMFVLGMDRDELSISSGLSGKHLCSTFMYSCHFFFFHQAFCSFTITPRVYLCPFVSVLSSFCFLFLCFTFHSPCFLNCGEQTSAKQETCLLVPENSQDLGFFDCLSVEITGLEILTSLFCDVLSMVIPERMLSH